MVRKMPKNKGSALYYVMLMLMVVTIILSGALYATYRNAIITNDYSSSEQDYIVCDSALEALRGQLAARLEGTQLNEFNERVANVNDTLFGKSGLEKDIYSLYYEELDLGEYGDLIEYSGIDTQSNKKFIDAKLYSVGDGGSRLAFIVKVNNGTVSVSAEIAFDVGANNYLGKGVFRNYTISTITPEATPTPQEEGGSQS